MKTTEIINETARSMRFFLPKALFSAVAVYQHRSSVDRRWNRPTVSVSSITHETETDILLHAEALRQAAEVFAKWNMDTGEETVR